MDYKTKGIFDDLAGTYTNDFDEATVRQLVRWMCLKPEMRVLEAGCGNGDFTPYLLESIGEDRLVCLLDISPEMIKKARKKLSVPKFNGHKMLFFVADVMECDVQQESFDVIVCFNCFPHFSDKPKALSNFHRLLDNGGRLIICHDKSRAEINATHAKHGMAHGSHFPDNRKMIKLLERAGFIVQVLFNTDSYFVQATKLSE